MSRHTRAIEQVADEYGATVRWQDGRQKHANYTLVLPDGTIIRAAVSQGLRNDSYKIKTWARQNIRRALKAKINGTV